MGTPIPLSPPEPPPPPLEPPFLLEGKWYYGQFTAWQMPAVNCDDDYWKVGPGWCCALGADINESYPDGFDVCEPGQPPCGSWGPPAWSMCHAVEGPFDTIEDCEF